MRVTRSDAARLAAEVRATVPTGESVAEVVREIVEAVRAGGDEVLIDCERRFGGGDEPIAVTQPELAAALHHIDADLRSALLLARGNVATVARAGVMGNRVIDLPQGQTIVLREVPVRRAGIYAPSGQAPYPSSVIMGVATAKAAGVEEVVVCARHPVMLAACAICGADEVYRVGGAHAIAALAYGTETIAPVDVIAGPGSLYAQEAKRQVMSVVGIDGFAGPSDLVVIASEGADPELVAADLLAQAEHGEGTLVVAVSPDPALLAGLPDAAVRVEADDLDAALAFAEALAPEHLQLVGDEAEYLAPRVTSAGCVFVGAGAGTAFGDYVAGSNHVLPTEGAARFASGLNVRHFTRVMAEVHITEDAAAALAGPGAAIAHAEGFEAHARSMELRLRFNQDR